MRRTATIFVVTLLGLATLAACGSSSSSGSASSGSAASAAASGSSPTDDVRGQTVVLITHDAWAVTPSVLTAFENATGITVQVQPGQDAGAVVNQAILTKDNPQGDVLYGVDNTLIARANAAGLFEPYTSPALAQIDPRFDIDPTQHRVTPVDYSDVCINYDKRAFGGPGQPAAPATLDDLVQPAYKGKLVVENPATSSPGLAFLLATVDRYGDPGYLDYWKKLRDNGVQVVDGWTQAYNDSFTLGGGSGGKTLVVSYATSPPADVYYAQPAKDSTDVGVMTDGCYRQVEAAGVLHGTKHLAAAEKVVDFLASPELQADVPLNMFVFPVRTGTPLPDVFTKFVVDVANPIQLPPDKVAAGSDKWVADWTSTVLR